VVHCKKEKGKGLPQQAEVAQGVPSRLRPQIFLTLVTTRVVGSQPYAPAAFIPGEIPGNHFQRLSRPQGTWKKSSVTPPGIDIGTVRLVAQCLNHYAIPGPQLQENYIIITNLMHRLLFIYKLLFLYMFRAIKVHLQEDTLYTCSIWHCHSVNRRVVEYY